MPQIRNAVIVITGASSGIGRATALLLAKRGAHVVLAARQVEPLDQLVKECEQFGAAALAAPTDVTDEAAMRRLAQAAVDRFGHIDAWINNAAVTMFARFEDGPSDVYRRVIETNLFGYIHGARAVLPHFRGRRRGVLINVSAVAGQVGQPYASAYVVSKWAIRGLSESLRQELLDAPGIEVCTILPPSVDTPLFQHGANYTGRAPKPVPPVYSAEQVGRIIIGCIERPRREASVGVYGTLMIALHAVAPRWFDRLARRHEQRPRPQGRGSVASPSRCDPEAPNAGNVLEPMDGLHTITGGWTVHDGRRAERSGGAWWIGMAMLPVAWWLLRRRRRLPQLCGSHVSEPIVA